MLVNVYPRTTSPLAPRRTSLDRDSSSPLLVPSSPTPPSPPTGIELTWYGSTGSETREGRRKMSPGRNDSDAAMDTESTDSSYSPAPTAAALELSSDFAPLCTASALSSSPTLGENFSLVPAPLGREPEENGEGNRGISKKYGSLKRWMGRGIAGALTGRRRGDYLSEQDV